MYEFAYKIDGNGNMFNNLSSFLNHLFHIKVRIEKSNYFY